MTNAGNGAGPNLREAAVSGVRWISIARLVSEVVGFGSTVVLAHLIPPAEFGRVAIALIMGVLSYGLTNEGFGNPLVQRRELDRAHIESAVLLSLAFGIVMTAGAFLLAPIVAAPLFGDRTAELIQLASPLFLLVGIRVTPSAMMQRRLAFRRMSVQEMTSFIGGALTGVALALAGLDGEAIVIGLLVQNALLTILCFAAAPSPLPRWHRKAARENMAFGLPAAMASLVHASFRNVDYAILGARLSASQLGFYYRAFGFAVNYPNRMSAIVARVSFPVYSRASGVDEIHALRGRFVRVQAAVIFPVLAMLVATAPVLIPWLLGPRWQSSVLPMQILAFAGMAACVFETLAPVLLATGKVRSLLGYNVAGLILYGVCVYLAAPHGLTAVCVAVVGVHVTLLLGTYYFLLQRLLGLPMRRLWDDMAPAGVGSLALLGVAYALRSVLDGAGLPVVPVLAAAGAGGTLAYLAVLRTLFPAVWSDLLMLVRRVLFARKSTSDPAGERVPSQVPAQAGTS